MVWRVLRDRLGYSSTFLSNRCIYDISALGGRLLNWGTTQHQPLYRLRFFTIVAFVADLVQWLMALLNIGVSYVWGYERFGDKSGVIAGLFRGAAKSGTPLVLNRPPVSGTNQTLIPSNFHPKRECGSKRVKVSSVWVIGRAPQPFWSTIVTNQRQEAQKTAGAPLGRECYHAVARFIFTNEWVNTSFPYWPRQNSRDPFRDCRTRVYNARPTAV